MPEAKKTFPMLPVAHWWALRRKFKQSLPGVVTTNYLATVLQMGVDSARANVMPFLRALGIIDDDGKTTERAKHWRDDGHYPEVCKAILKDVYPQELLEAVPDPRANRDAAKRWFANHSGAGDAACSRMTALYTVLAEADPSGGQETGKPPQVAKVKKASTQRASASKLASTAVDESLPPPPPHSQAASQSSSTSKGPDVNLNLQIHISADASADQIEQIFASMAKHIYGRG